MNAPTSPAMQAMLQQTEQQRRIARVRRAPTITGKVWLIIATAGEPVALQDIHAALLTAMENPPSAYNLRNTLNGAKQRGNIVGTGKRNNYKYKITPTCTVPCSITVRDVLEVGLA